MTCVIQGVLQVFGCIGFLLTRQVLELIKKELAAEHSVGEGLYSKILLHNTISTTH